MVLKSVVLSLFRLEELLLDLRHLSRTFVNRVVLHFKNEFETYLLESLSPCRGARQWLGRGKPELALISLHITAPFKRSCRTLVQNN